MIKLEQFTRNDIPVLLKWLEKTNEEFLVQFSGPRYTYPLSKEQILETMDNNSYILFKVIGEDTGEIVGHCQFLGVNTGTKSAKIGRILLIPEKRGHGYGAEIIRQLQKYGEKKLLLQKIILKVYDFNKSAYNCYLKCGFVETGREEIYFESINKTWNTISMEYIVS
ncbi:MAG: GNAT family N-acetyltransferase [Deltaproteobacteria bacterium]|nr:GNAT family N-acetyltransferase [Deltaproteobacteria bacterium]